MPYVHRHCMLPCGGKGKRTVGEGALLRRGFAMDWTEDIQALSWEVKAL